VVGGKLGKKGEKERVFRKGRRCFGRGGCGGIRAIGGSLRTASGGPGEVKVEKGRMRFRGSGEET